MFKASRFARSVTLRIPRGAMPGFTSTTTRSSFRTRRMFEEFGQIAGSSFATRTAMDLPIVIWRKCMTCRTIPENSGISLLCQSSPSNAGNWNRRSST